jgi:hypothetical protein
MALSGSVLSAALRSALLANTNARAVDNAALTALCDCIADTVVAHITSAAVVNPLGLIAPGGSGGPVTGAGSIT